MAIRYFPLQRVSKEISLLSGRLRRTFFLLLFLLLVLQSSLFAQNQYDISQFGRETGTFFTQPLRWEGSDWLKLGAMGAGSILLMKFVDQPGRDLALRDRSYFYSAPIEGGRMYGELYTPVILFAGFAAHSLITNDISTRKIAYEIGQASLYAGIIDFALKGIIGRARPYANEGTSSYHPLTFFSGDDYHSFPGGHTTAAFVLSTILSRNAGPTWLKILAYLPAVATPISRIYQDQHWVSDCVVGAAFGYCIATWVVDQHEQGENRLRLSCSYPLTVRYIIN